MLARCRSWCSLLWNAQRAVVPTAPLEGTALVCPLSPAIALPPAGMGPSRPACMACACAVQVEMGLLSEQEAEECITSEFNPGEAGGALQRAAGGTEGASGEVASVRQR